MAQIQSLTIKDLSLSSTRTIAQGFWITTFALLTAVGAQIEIAHVPVPYTLQTFFVVLAGALLGKRNGFLSMALYLVLGAAGFPVFSSGGFGFMKLLGPTGGYLIAFPIAAFLVGYLASRRRSFAWMVLSMVAGLCTIFVLGTLQLGVVMGTPWNETLRNGFLIFSLWDVLKLTAAAAIARQFLPKASLKS